MFGTHPPCACAECPPDEERCQAAPPATVILPTRIEPVWICERLYARLRAGSRLQSYCDRNCTKPWLRVCSWCVNRADAFAKEAAKAKREADAEKLFEQAEAALEKNKSLAMTTYQRLLKEYGDTDVVSKSKKATIEERIALLKSKAK